MYGSNLTVQTMEACQQGVIGLHLEVLSHQPGLEGRVQQRGGDAAE